MKGFLLFALYTDIKIHLETMLVPINFIISIYYGIKHFKFQISMKLKIKKYDTAEILQSNCQWLVFMYFCYYHYRCCFCSMLGEHKYRLRMKDEDKMTSENSFRRRYSLARA